MILLVSKTYNRKQQFKILRDNGYTVERCRGSHYILTHKETGKKILVAANNRNCISDTAFNKTIKKYNLAI